MPEQIHDDEPDVSEPVVRALLAAELPQWAESPIEYLDTSGTDNAMWRVRLQGAGGGQPSGRDWQPDVVVRLPRRPGAAAGVLHETSILRQLSNSALGALVGTPRLVHVGDPSDAFPHHWSVLEWLDGIDAWTARDRQEIGGEDLAEAVAAVGATDVEGVRPRSPGDRGGPLGPVLEALEAWLDGPEWNAADLIDVAAVRRLAAEAWEVVDEPVASGFVHGDLIPGNLLVDDAGHLSAIIDWGGAGTGDLAQDLAPAWAVLSTTEREVFRNALEVDDATWIRARAFELEHAVGGILYYVPKKHPLGDVMSRTLERILTAD